MISVRQYCGKENFQQVFYELYADIFVRSYASSIINPIYFNAFNRRQRPDGVYAAIISKWTAAIINGDVKVWCSFHYIRTVIQPELLDPTNTDESASNQVYNILIGALTSMNGLIRSVWQAVSNYVEFLRILQ